MSSSSKWRHNVAKVSASKLTFIERVYAKDGLAHVIEKTGKHIMLTVRDAAVRAQSLNEGNCPVHVRKQRDQLIEHIIDVCREAKRQQEVPDKQTILTSNLMAGLTPDGRKVKAPTPEEAQFNNWALRYPMLKEDEILTMLRDTKLRLPDKLQMMSKVNDQRVQELMAKKAASGQLIVNHPA